MAYRRDSSSAKLRCRISIPETHKEYNEQQKKNFVVYHILLKGRDFSKLIYRRFKHFVEFHKAWKDIYTFVAETNPLPKKLHLFEQTTTLINSRRVKLEHYLQSLSLIDCMIPFLCQFLEVDQNVIKFTRKLSTQPAAKPQLFSTGIVDTKDEYTSTGLRIMSVTPESETAILIRKKGNSDEAEQKAQEDKMAFLKKNAKYIEALMPGKLVLIPGLNVTGDLSSSSKVSSTSGDMPSGGIADISRLKYPKINDETKDEKDEKKAKTSNEKNVMNDYVINSENPNFFYAKVLYDFIPEIAKSTNPAIDLSNCVRLKKGQTVLVADDSDPSWWYGRVEETISQGFFPSNYVRVQRIRQKSAARDDIVLKTASKPIPFKPAVTNSSIKDITTNKVERTGENGASGGSGGATNNVVKSNINALANVFKSTSTAKMKLQHNDNSEGTTAVNASASDSVGNTFDTKYDTPKKEDTRQNTGNQESEDGSSDAYREEKGKNVGNRGGESTGLHRHRRSHSQPYDSHQLHTVIQKKTPLSKTEQHINEEKSETTSIPETSLLSSPVVSTSKRTNNPIPVLRNGPPPAKGIVDHSHPAKDSDTSSLPRVSSNTSLQSLSMGESYTSQVSVGSMKNMDSGVSVEKGSDGNSGNGVRKSNASSPNRSPDASPSVTPPRSPSPTDERKSVGSSGINLANLSLFKMKAPPPPPPQRFDRGSNASSSSSSPFVKKIPPPPPKTVSSPSSEHSRVINSSSQMSSSNSQTPKNNTPLSSSSSFNPSKKVVAETSTTTNTTTQTSSVPSSSFAISPSSLPRLTNISNLGTAPTTGVKDSSSPLPPKSHSLKAIGNTHVPLSDIQFTSPDGNDNQAHTSGNMPASPSSVQKNNNLEHALANYANGTGQGNGGEGNAFSPSSGRKTLNTSNVPPPQKNPLGIVPSPSTPKKAAESTTTTYPPSPSHSSSILPTSPANTHRTPPPPPPPPPGKKSQTPPSNTRKLNTPTSSQAPSSTPFKIPPPPPKVLATRSNPHVLTKDSQN